MKSKRILNRILFLSQIVLICIGIQSPVYSQKFERFSNEEGFNQNTINTITQDAYGFLWFGTPNGLIKYDGYDFNSYSSEANGEAGSISDNNIVKLFTDAEGILWIGTVKGVDIYVPWLDKFYKITLPAPFSISHITADAQGDVWLSGQDNLYRCKRVDSEKGVFEISNNLLAEYSEIVTINDFLIINESSCLLATTQGLYHIVLTNQNQQPAVNSMTVIPSFSTNEITKLLKSQNIYWIGTKKGLFKSTLEGNRMHIIRKFDTLGHPTKADSKVFVKTIFEDDEGSIWIGTIENGLSKYIPDSDSFINYPFDAKKESGLSSKRINVVYQDDFHVIWIGTAQGGVNKMDLSQKPFTTYSFNPYDTKSISDNLITAILEDSKGNLWIAGYSGSLSRSITPIDEINVNRLQFKDLKVEFDMEERDIIRSIFEDDQGFIWFGTDLSLVVYNPANNRFKKVTLRTKSDIELGHGYFSIMQLDDEKIILGGKEIVILDNPWKTILNETNPKIDVHSILSLGDYGVHTLLKDAHDNYWFGAKNGLFELEINDEAKSIKSRPITINGETAMLSNQNIFSLHDDNKGNIWVGTFGGGLNKISLDSNGKTQKIEFFRKNNSLPDDAVYGILQESDSLLWLSTDMGLVRFYTENDKIDVFDVRDGLAQNNFRQGSYFRGKSGYYFFGGLKGLTIFKPEDINLNTQPPKILITDLLVNNQKVRIGEEFNDRLILKKSITETKSIAVSQEQQIIGFDIAVKHSSMPFKNKVAYKLEGLNEEWVEENTGKTTITYTNLSAGDYIFRVKGANRDGVWSTNTKSLNIKILPPWYQTWWSYLLFALLIIGICAGIVVYLTQHEKLKQRLKYEEIDKSRLQTINQGKFRYFTNLSHEFRTPLTLIAGPLEYIIRNNTDTNNNKYLAIIQKNTKRLISLADQLITFRKAEQGYVNLKLSKDTLGGFIYPTTEAFENYASQKNINFFYKLNTPDEEIIIDVEKTERIIFNLLSNAFKNTPPLGSISIEAEVKIVSGQKMIYVDIVDSGKGIPAEDLDNIFARFYQLGNNNESTSGGGIGLAFCKTMLHLLGGTISVTSNQGVETRFSVVLPSKSGEEYGIEAIDFSEKSFVKDWIPLSSELIAADLHQQSSKSPKKYTLLVVENEVDVQTFLESALSMHYNVVVADNGVEALEKIAQREPDLVISDVMMPVMDGFELCKKIKSDSALCHMSVLLLTALGDNEDIIKGLEFGADEYISKPFSLKHLELRIEKLIQNKVALKEHFSKKSELPPKNLELIDRDKGFLSNTIEVIEKNIADSNFGVQELASEMGLSTAHFYRRLKQLTGQIPNVYLRNFRLQRAAEIMKANKGLNVTEIMYQIGIESNSYFSSSFKKLHGVTPSAYLKKNTSSEDVE